MGTDFIPLSGRAEFFPSYPGTAPFSNQKSQSDEKDVSTSSRLQRRRLITQEVTRTYFHEIKVLRDKGVFSLNRNRFSQWEEVLSSEWILLTTKTQQVQRRVLLRAIELKRVSHDLQLCWRNLKESFQHYYLQLKQKQEI